METICNFFPEINVHIGKLSAGCACLFLTPLVVICDSAEEILRLISVDNFYIDWCPKGVKNDSKMFLNILFCPINGPKLKKSSIHNDIETVNPYISEAGTSEWLWFLFDK